MNRKLTIIIFLSFALVFTNKAYSQTLGGQSSLDKYVQKARIGLVDEFFNRFNGTEMHPDLPKSAKDSRKRNLMMLYNLGMFSSQKDTLFKKASLMADIIIKENIQLHYEDSTWAAVAHCVGSLNGQPKKFDLYLTVEKHKGNSYKWVINRAEGSMFSIKADNKEKRSLLSPDDHETNFMSLSHMTIEHPQNVSKFMRKGFGYDPTSVFAYLVHSKKLRIEYVENLEFVFTQVPGYIFHIRYFEREKSNTGWLISSFKAISGKQKDTFLRRIHGTAIPPTATKNIPSKPSEVTSKTNSENLFTKNYQEKQTDRTQYVMLEKALVSDIEQCDSVSCLLLDPISKDTTTLRLGDYGEILTQTRLNAEASEAFKQTLLYKKSFVKENFQKDCTFLPDIAMFMYKRGKKVVTFAYSFYCNVCHINHKDSTYVYNGELIRASILQIALDTYSQDRYLRRIAGITR